MTIGWHFTTGDHLAYGDGRPIVVGEWLEWPSPKPLVLCDHGLHFCERAVDALAYAPGPIAWRIEGDGEMIRGDDKIVCRRRRATARVDARWLLARFARACALDVAHLWSPPSIVRRFLLGGEFALAQTAAAAAWAETTAERAEAAWAAEAVVKAAWAWPAEAAAKAAAKVAAKAAAAWPAAEVTVKAAWPAAEATAQNVRLTNWLEHTVAGETLPDRIDPEEIMEPARTIVRAWEEARHMGAGL